MIANEGNEFSENQRVLSALILSHILDVEELDILQKYMHSFPDFVSPVIMRGFIEVHKLYIIEYSSIEFLQLTFQRNKMSVP